MKVLLADIRHNLQRMKLDSKLAVARVAEMRQQTDEIIARNRELMKDK